MYVRDLNFILDKIIYNSNIKEPLIVSSDSVSSIIDIVEIIKESLDFKNKVIFDEGTTIGEQIKIVNTSKLESVIGNYNFTDLKTGIQETINWYVNN